jgi:hypothetical protein
MSDRALFEGLVADEDDRPVTTAVIGGEAFYVVNDQGFLRHVECERVDRRVLEHMAELIRGNEELISEGTMRMLGQDDIFTKAAIEASLRSLDDRFSELIAQGLPPEARAWLGLNGFRVIINVHGEVVRVEQPSREEDPPE